MTKDIIQLSALFLGLTDVNDYLKQPETTPSSDTLDKLEDLLLFTNYVLREVTKNYYPLTTEETLYSNNQCEIEYSSLSKTAIAIKGLVNQTGHSVTFNLYPNYIKVGTPNSKYKITYNYTPNKIKTINEPLTLPLGLDYVVISYGVASEYALSRLLYSEADMWESKFKNALENIKSRSGDRRFFARRLT